VRTKGGLGITLIWVLDDQQIPPVRRGIANSPLRKAAASALLGTRPGQ
jgi:hypothetical protein